MTKFTIQELTSICFTILISVSNYIYVSIFINNVDIYNFFENIIVMGLTINNNQVIMSKLVSRSLNTHDLFVPHAILSYSD